MSSDQTILESTHARCIRITWSGKDFERTFVWTVVWNLPDQRSLWSGTVWSEVTLVWDGLIRGIFKRTLVWPETTSTNVFQASLFFYWHLLSLVRVNNKTAFWSELLLKIWWVSSEPRGPADSNCRSPQEKILNQSRSRRFYANLSKFFYSVKSINKWHTQYIFWAIFLVLFSLAIIGFSLVDNKSDNINFQEMHIL